MAITLGQVVRQFRARPSRCANSYGFFPCRPEGVYAQGIVQVQEQGASLIIVAGEVGCFLVFDQTIHGQLVNRTLDGGKTGRFVDAYRSTQRVE
jgi:hypothetical protein